MSHALLILGSLFVLAIAFHVALRQWIALLATLQRRKIRPGQGPFFIHQRVSTSRVAELRDLDAAERQLQRWQRATSIDARLLSEFGYDIAGCRLAILSTLPTGPLPQPVRRGHGLQWRLHAFRTATRAKARQLTKRARSVATRAVHRLRLLRSAALDPTFLGVWSRLGAMVLAVCALGLVFQPVSHGGIEAIARFGFLATQTAAFFACGIALQRRHPAHSASGFFPLAIWLTPVMLFGAARILPGASGPMSFVIGASALILCAGLVHWCASLAVHERLHPWSLALIGPWVIAVLPRTDSSILIGSIACLPAATLALASRASGRSMAPGERERNRDALAGVLMGGAFSSLLSLLWLASNVPQSVSSAVSIGFSLLALVFVSLCHRSEVNGSAIWLRGPKSLWIAVFHIAPALLCLYGIQLAWPHPFWLLAASGLAFGVLSGQAARLSTSWVHGAALVCIAPGWLALFHWLRGNIEFDRLAGSMRDALSSVDSSYALAALAVLLGLASEGLVRGNRRRIAGTYVLGAAAAAVASLTLGALPARALADPASATILCGLIAVAALALNARWRQPIAASMALALAVAATLWFLDWHCPHVHGLWAATLSAQALAFGAWGMQFLVRRNLAAQDPAANRGWLAEPLVSAAEATACLALLAAVWTFAEARVFSTALVASGFLLGALLVGLGLLRRSPLHIALAAAILVPTVAAGVAPRTAAVGLAGLAAGWLALAWLTDARHPQLRAMLRLASAITTITAWWMLLRWQDFDFQAHYALWLTPIAGAWLLHAHFDNAPASKRRLALRWAALLLFFGAPLSSALADVAAHRLTAPVALVALGVGGVLAGLFFQQRAYAWPAGLALAALFGRVLWLGFAEHQPWAWWALGISTGLALLTTSALLERSAGQSSLCAFPAADTKPYMKAG